MGLRTALAVLAVVSHFGIDLPAQKNERRIPTGTGSIAGRVIDRDTNRPLASALVTLQPSAGASALITTTDDGGRYLFEGVGPGEYLVAASHDGYVSQEFGFGSDEVVLAAGGVVHPGRVSFALTAGQAREGVNVLLDRGGSIAGRITRADGSPIKDATVNALRIRDERSLAVAGSSYTRTNAQGDYEIPSVRPGSYYISVAWTDPEMLKARVRTSSGPTYYPGTNSSKEAASIQVMAGSTIRAIDVVLRLPELYRVSGHVLRTSSAGRVDAYLIPPRGPMRPITVGDNGAFEIPYLEPGRYAFWARASEDQSEAASVPIDLQEDVEDFIVPLLPTGHISGRVVTEDGEPFVFSGAEVVADLVDETGREIEPYPRDRGAIDDEGRFQIAGVFGPRKLRLIGTQRHADRVLSGKTRVETVVVGPGERIDALTIVAVR
jgi:hypothetical protein